jgi:antitoxin (DNA-binding transcriptional repressor) of toxin-antitoxin stability system
LIAEVPAAMTVSIEEAKSKLSELVDELAPEEELVLQKRGKAVAKLIRLTKMRQNPISDY